LRQKYRVSADDKSICAAEGSARFRTTLWTVVLEAADRSSPKSDAALTNLCQNYWTPVYAFIRKKGCPPERAEDLTQSFFVRLLEKNYLARAARNRGRFRSFIMTSVENFLHDEHDRATSLKRGGGQALISLDVESAEEEYLTESVDTLTPASAFDRRWAGTVLDNAMQRLGAEYQETERSLLFEHLQPHLWGDPDAIPYRDLSRQLTMSLVNLRVSAHRMRQRFREVLREEIAQTVSEPSEIDAEIQHLIMVVSR
jgi:RNA polymerase sigma factor (sigma-70 family)